MTKVTPSQEIDQIILKYGGWKGETIKQLRDVITTTNPQITEEIKWKMRSRPEGLPVWMYGGIICYIETFKDNMKLVFHKGSQLSDPSGLFNARLNSTSVRAIEIREDTHIDESGIKELVKSAIIIQEEK